MAFKNLLVLSAFVQLAISAATPGLHGPTRLSSRTLAQGNNGTASAPDAGSTPQVKPTTEASGEAPPIAAADGPPAHEKAADLAAPKSPEGAAPAPKASPDVSAPKAPAAPLVTINKVANEVVNTNTTSTEISAFNGLLQKNVNGNFPTPAEAAPIRNTTVVTNKVSHEVLTTNSIANQTSTSHSNPPEKAAAQAPKGSDIYNLRDFFMQAGKTDNGSAADSAAPAGVAPHESAHPPSAEKASSDAPASSSKEVDVSVKAPKQPDASPSAHETAASEGPAPKSVDVSFSKPTPVSNSDGPQTSESSSPHQVATEVSVSSTPAGPAEAAAKKVQVNVGKPAAAENERSEPETSAHTPSVQGGSGHDAATGPAASTKPENLAAKPGGDVFHDSDDPGEVAPADKLVKPNQPSGQNGDHSSSIASNDNPTPIRPKDNPASDRYPKAKRSLIAASTLAYLLNLIIA
ncbi:hypothetical protein VP01_2263g3 [Puccinia sorghi]|uniref:Uncharacterized protein n=1 Tax=Puccinia sorghi TaxID=27349 RepID=A0A0L6VA66_9BASI|nr:hypothetical protein VP01_2263g3 [Puccinia sorghi]